VLSIAYHGSVFPHLLLFTPHLSHLGIISSSPIKPPLLSPLTRASHLAPPGLVLSHILALCFRQAIAIRHTMSSQPEASPKAVEAGIPIQASSSPSASSRSPLWPVAPGGLRDYLMTQVNPDLSTIPLAAYCFMTGWMCVALAPLAPASFRSLTLSINFVQRRSLFLRHIRLVRIPNRQLATGKRRLSFPTRLLSAITSVNTPFTSAEPRSSRSRSPAFSRVLQAIVTHHSTSRINRLSPR
jgi:hypothetical protein